MNHLQILVEKLTMPPLVAPARPLHVCAVRPSISSSCVTFLFPSFYCFSSFVFSPPVICAASSDLPSSYSHVLCHFYPSIWSSLPHHAFLVTNRSEAVNNWERCTDETRKRKEGTKNTWHWNGCRRESPSFAVSVPRNKSRWWTCRKKTISEIFVKSGHTLFPKLCFANTCGPYRRHTSVLRVCNLFLQFKNSSKGEC